jgi:hypothetical protein
MLKFVACPGCEQEHLLPPSVSLEVSLECPQCGEKLNLASYVAEHFSVWKVTHDPATHPLANSAIAESVTNSINSTTNAKPANSLGKDLELVEENAGQDDDSPVDLKLEEVVERPAAKKPWLETQPITHEQFERMKRKDRSPIWTILQIALGGLSAFPLALVILWWGLGRDFGGAGPTVAKYAPWLVPSKFHPASDSEDSVEDLASAKPSPGQSGFRNFDDVLPPDPSDLDSSDLGPSDQDSDVMSSPSLPTLQANSGVDSAPILDSEAASSNSAGPPTASLDRAAMLAANEGVNATQKTEAPNVKNNIFARITRCEQHIESWRTAVLSDEGDQRQIAQDIYGELLAISQELSNFPADSPIFRVIRDKLQPVSRSIKRQPDIHKIIIQGAQHWASDRNSEGPIPLALICEIESVEESDNGWLVVPVAKDCPETITHIEIPSIMAPQLDPGQKLFLLGMLEATEEENGDEAQAPKLPDFRAHYLHGQ